MRLGRLAVLREDHRHWMLAALMVGVFLSPVNVNFASVALPTIRDYYSVSVEQVAWVGTAYFIPTVVFMPLQTYLGERYGLRLVYTAGLVLLSMGAFASAAAPSLGWLLASRVVQGIGWSALYPLALVMIRVHYPLEAQGTVMGTWESAVGVATIISPVIAGVIIEVFGWHGVFVALGLVAAFGALLSVFSIPVSAKVASASEFDWRGAVMLTLAVLLILTGITRKAPSILLPGMLAFTGWAWLARRVQQPFVDPAIFGNLRFMSASSAAMLRMIISMAALMALPLFLEDVRGLSAASVGVILPIYSLFLFLSSRPGGRWSDHVGARFPSVVGFAFMTLGVFLLAFIDLKITLVFIAIALVIRGIGAGLAQAPPAQVATSVVSAEQQSASAGVYGMVRYGGLALGSALVGIFLNARFDAYGSNGKDAAAIPAFQELFIVLAFLGLLGIGLSWAMGNQAARKTTIRALAEQFIQKT